MPVSARKRRSSPLAHPRGARERVGARRGARGDQRGDASDPFGRRLGQIERRRGRLAELVEDQGGERRVGWLAAVEHAVPGRPQDQLAQQRGNADQGAMAGKAAARVRPEIERAQRA